MEVVDGSVQWFGPPWGAPACAVLPRREVPVGIPCGHCGTPFEDGDQGLLLPVSMVRSAEDRVVVFFDCYHVDCLIWLVTGPKPVRKG